jgi:hypothetical protein
MRKAEVIPALRPRFQGHLRRMNFRPQGRSWLWASPFRACDPVPHMRSCGIDWHT